MPLPGMRRRTRALAAAAIVAAGLLAAAGCTPEPEPDPEPTGFVSEEEALEAARATYEGYIEATNEVDLSDMATAEPVYEWLIGDALSDARQVYSEAHAAKTTRSGESKVVEVELDEIDLAATALSVDVCLDVSAVVIYDEDGESTVDSSRSDVQSIRASLAASDTTVTGLAITDTDGREDGLECES